VVTAWCIPASWKRRSRMSSPIPFSAAYQTPKIDPLERFTEARFAAKTGSIETPLH
jgi:hypothetical protein